MSADSFIAYCGLRFEISSREVEDVELQRDDRIIKAKKSGLKFYFGRFGGNRENHILFVGSPVGMFGVENSAEASFSLVELQALFFKTQTKLLEAGFEGKTEFHFMFEPD